MVRCDECGKKVDATGFFGGTIVCKECVHEDEHYKEAVKRGGEIFA